MRPHRRRFGTAAPPAAPTSVGGLWLLGALTMAACTQRFTVLHTDGRSAAVVTAAAAVISLMFTAADRSTPSSRRLGWAAGLHAVAVLTATWLVTDMTTSGW